MQQEQENEDNCSLAGMITYFIKPGSASSIPQGQSLMAAGRGKRSLRIVNNGGASQYKVTKCDPTDKGF